MIHYNLNILSGSFQDAFFSCRPKSLTDPCVKGVPWAGSLTKLLQNTQRRDVSEVQWTSNGYWYDWLAYCSSDGRHLPEQPGLSHFNRACIKYTFRSTYESVKYKSRSDWEICRLKNYQNKTVGAFWLWIEGALSVFSWSSLSALDPCYLWCFDRHLFEPVSY